jgi:hypothetical protein
MDKKTEEIVLLNFLKSGFSTRNLDTLMGLSQIKTKGWNSWDILKKYQLDKNDKGKLYLYSNSQCIEFINSLMKNPKVGSLYKYIKSAKPKIYEGYFDKYVLARSPTAFYLIFTGETRNITQGFFSYNKKLIGICQFKDCYETSLETAHFKISRPKIFKKCAKKNELGNFLNYKIYDVYLTMHDYFISTQACE